MNPYKVHESDQMMQLYKLQLKIAVGARYIITQLGYNLRKLYELKQYLERKDWGTSRCSPTSMFPPPRSRR